MSQRTKTQWDNLYGALASQFPDNDIGAITEVVMRAFGQDASDTFVLKTEKPNRGAFDATGTDEYPATGTGSGTSGAILAGDWWYVSISGDNTDYGGTLPLRTFFTALVDAPGTTASNWKIT